MLSGAGLRPAGIQVRREVLRCSEVPAPMLMGLRPDQQLCAWRWLSAAFKQPATCSWCCPGEVRASTNRAWLTFFSPGWVLRAVRVFPAGSSEPTFPTPFLLPQVVVGPIGRKWLQVPCMVLF